MKILVVDDTRTQIELMKYFLESWGHQIVTVSNGLEALEALEREDFPIIITDWVMPVMDGLSLIEEVRKNHSDPFKYIILLSIKSEGTEKLCAIETGADAYLVKPYKPEELKAYVKAATRIVDLERRLSVEKEFNENLYNKLKLDAEAGARVQESLLPKAYMDIGNLKIAHLFRPCTDLAGDIYNIFRLDHDTIVFFLADVSGHGVGPSLISVMISEFFTSMAYVSPVESETSDSGHRPSLKDLPAVAKCMNEHFFKELEDDRYFTIIYGTIDLSSLILSFFSAGHPGLITVTPDEKVDIHESTGPPMGMSIEETFEVVGIPLIKGQRIFVYSDGLTEARRGRDFFGENRLCDFLAGQTGEDLKVCLDKLESQLEIWAGHSNFFDDISIIAIEVT